MTAGAVPTRRQTETQPRRLPGQQPPAGRDGAGSSAPWQPPAAAGKLPHCQAPSRGWQLASALRLPQPPQPAAPQPQLPRRSQPQQPGRGLARPHHEQQPGCCCGQPLLAPPQQPVQQQRWQLLLSAPQFAPLPRFRRRQSQARRQRGRPPSRAWRWSGARQCTCAWGGG